MFRRSSLLLAAALLVGCSPQKPASGPVADAGNSPEPVYGKELQFDVPLDNPVGIAKTKDAIYAVGGRQLLEFDLTGKVKQKIDLADDATCVTVSPEHRIFVASLSTVYEIVSGKPIELIRLTSPKAHITSMSTGPIYLWIADAGSRRIQRADMRSLELTEFGQKTKDYPGLIVPSPHLDVAVLSNNDVLWTNPGAHRFELHNEEGKLLKAWGKQSNDIDGFCGCCNPTDIAAYTDSTIVTSEKGLPRINIYWRGKFECVVAPASDRSEKSVGIDLAADGERIYALDPFAKNITVYRHKDRLK